MDEERELLFGEVEECDICPFASYNYKDWNSYFYCHDDPNGWHPCEYMEKYGNLTLSEVVEKISASIHKAELASEEMREMQRERKQKKDIAVQKGLKTKRENYTINNEINRLRRLIKQLNVNIENIIDMKSSIAFVNSVFYQTKKESREEIIAKTPRLQELISLKEQSEKKLNELLKERKRINAERRRKNG